MVWVVFVLKIWDTQANTMVRAVSCYQKLGNSRKYNGLGCFLLSEVRKLKQIEWFGLFLVIESQETQANIMVWAVFCYQKSGNSSKYNCLVCFLLSKVRKIKQTYCFGLFFVIQS